MTDPIPRAVRALRAGEIVGYPTDTLYGLAVTATNPAAVEALVRAKGRATHQPISVAFSSFEELEPYLELSEENRSFVRTHLPGPYTLLAAPSARARREFAPSIAGGDSIGIRIPDHPLARALAEHAGPITATSANRHGEPPARTAAEARRVFGKEVTVYLPSDPAPSGAPSTLVDLTRGVRAIRGRK
ncbi:MAG: L-threonylcarbamoyladenylate synthase [Thermoplasmata archaeon]